MSAQSTKPDLDAQVIIRVHAKDRPFQRAIDSVLSCPRAGVILVAHGLTATELDAPSDPRLDVVEVSEGVGFPGVPSNAGVAAATAPFVGLLDSDDFYEKGALDALLGLLDETGADAALAPLRLGDEAPALLPLTPRRSNLDPVRDRLFYRTAPLGLFRTSLMQDPDFRFDPTVPTGEDMRVTARLFSGGHNIAYRYGDPTYTVTDEASERATLTSRPVEEEFQALNNLVDDLWVAELPEDLKEALVVKVLRVHILGHVKDDDLRAAWRFGDFECVADLAQKVLALAPGALDVFVASEQDILNQLLSGSPETLEAAIQSSKTASLPQRVLPKKPWKATHREANIRRVLTSKWVSLFGV